MSQRLSLSLVVLVITTMFAGLLAAAGGGSAPFATRRIIVKFADGAPSTVRQAIMNDLGAATIKNLDLIDAEVWEVLSYSTTEAVAKYQMHEAIEYIEPDYQLQAVEIPNDPMFDELYGLHNTGQTGGTAGADIAAVSAWDVFTGSDDVVVVVIDTGVDYTHADLADNAWANPGEVPGNGIDDDGNGFIDDVRGWDFVNSDNDPMDDNGHGTHCSGTIGAVGDNGIGVVGVNWDVSIMGVKFLDSGGSGWTSDAILSIDYALTIPGVKVMSNSWGGGGYSEALEDAIQRAHDAGVLFVCAAGNYVGNTDINPNYPSCYTVPNVMSIAATDHNDDLASFSGYGPTTVDLGAPGDDIMSTLPGNGYGELGGTSMATPHVSGVAALIWGRFPAMTVTQVKALIMDSVDPIDALDGMCVTGGRLNAFNCIAEPDDIPPAAVDDLAASNATSSTVDLAWTATGDDGYIGTASYYDVRYSTAPIDETNFFDATAAGGVPDPASSGTPESMTLQGLDFSTAYYFALKVLDEYGNYSDISNLATGTTLGEPDIAVDPTSMTEELLSGGSSSQTLTVSNVGLGTLDFGIAEPTLILGSSIQGEYVAYGKDEIDPRTGGPVIEGRGGSDETGYRWIDSDEPGGPYFDWVDITGVGTLISMDGDDESTGPYPIGFDFEFYGSAFSEFYVCTNGFISFTSTDDPYSNQPIPNTGAPENLVAPFWDDLNFSSVDRCYYHNDGTRLIVEWYDVPHYSSGGPYTFEVILYPNGDILYQYLSMEDPTNSATVGTQNYTMDDGLQIAYNTDYIHDNMAIKISKLPQWVTVSPNSGRVWSGDFYDLSVDFDATGLLGGYYDANIVIASNDPDEPEVTIPVELHVIGAPDIAVDPTSLDFGSIFTGTTKDLTFLVSNPGTDQVEVTDIVSDNADFTASPTVLSIPPRSGELVTVTYAASAPGLSSGMITVYSNDPDEPEVYVAVQGTGLIPPEFTVTPDSLFADLMTGETDAQTITIGNIGGSDFVFDAIVELYNSGTVEMGDFEDIPKGEEGSLTGGPQTQGSGGPDTFGYTWIDSDEPGGPVFDWVDITTVGTVIPGLDGDEENLGDFPIGFNFPFYGNTFSTFRVCTNGYVTFGCDDSYYNNQELPNDYYRVCENMLAVWWEDLNFSYVERAYYHNDGSRLIITFDEVDRYSSYPEGGVYTFQIILYPSGTIVYQYLTMEGYMESATIGMQNQTKDDGLTIVYNAPYMHDNLAIKIAATPEWLSVSPAGGTVPPGGSMDLTALFNATDLYGGDYLGVVHIDGNDPNVPRYDVPAHLHVTGAPDIAADPDNLDFGTVYIGVTKPLQFYVVNNGTDLLTVTDIIPGSAEYLVDITAFTLEPMGSRLVTVNFSPTDVGDRSSGLTIQSDDPDEPEFVVPLTGYGLIAPEIEVTPAMLQDSLFVGETSDHTVRVENTGGSDLDFIIGVDLTGEVVMLDFEDVPKGEEGTQKGGPQTEGTGGPDGYGYTWVDSDEPGGPIFDWIDIISTGTLLPLDGDDESYGPVDIGFNFPFYGNSFSSFYVCTNGFISFTCDDDYYSNQWLPSDHYRVCENLIAGWWDDMKIDTGDYKVYVYEDGTKCIIEFYELARLSSYDPGVFTFEIILYPSGKILCQYLTMTGQIEDATLGIQNATKDDGLTVVYNDVYMHDNLAVEFAFISDWLSVNPTSGTIPAGSYMDLDVRFNATELFGGDYEGSLDILNNDPDEGLYAVPAYLHVTGAPDIDVDPLALDFGPLYISLTETLPVTVYNGGTDLLEVTSIAIDNGEFTTDLTPFSLSPRETRVLDVVYTPVTEGVVTGTLTLLTNDEDEAEVYVSLTGEGVVPPECEVDADSITAVAMEGMVVTETITVCNTGGSDLVYDIGVMQADQVQVYDYLEVPKGEEDPRPGILGTGGPDAFGYKWTDSDEPGGPIYDWVDISGVGTNIFGDGTYSDDGNEGPLPIGFPFDFYGNTFTEFYVCTNGFVSFTSTETYYGNQPLPNDGYRVPENLLAVFWDDLVHRSGTGSEPLPSAVYYYNDGGRLIIQFQHMYEIANYTDDINFQVILYPSGKVVYQYETLVVSTGDSHTIGIQNGTRDDGLTVVYDDYYVHEDMAIEFSAGPEWLTVSPVSGIIPAGECEDLTLTCDARGLVDGVYEGMVSIISNDLTDPTVGVPVTYIVDWEPAAWMDMDPNTLNLGSNGKWIDIKMGIPEGYGAMAMLEETVFFASGDDTLMPPNRFSIDGPDDYGLYYMHCKFSRSAVQEILPEGDSIEVIVAGEIEDVTYIKGYDYIRVIRPKMKHPNGGEVFTYNPDAKIIVTWETPANWDVDTYTVCFSSDGGESWEIVATDITTQSVIDDVRLVDTEQALYRVYAYQDDEVVGYDTSDEFFTISAVGAGIEDEVKPTVFMLHPNVPNPFVGTTMLRFDLPRDVHVTLNIYDVQGRLVQSLIDQGLTAGRYSIGWDGRDASGDRVASGIYYYRVDAGSWNDTQRMVVVR
jgi:subtilisin family serine protease